jgi:CheY-like chemotaxis protein
MRVAVISYDLIDAAGLTDRLRREGFDASALPLGQKALRQLRDEPPDAALIDLMRMPSYGRTIGAMIRESKSLRRIPLVFLEGEPEKTERVRALLPDAGFATLPKIAAALRKAGSGGPAASPIVPKSDLSVAQKLKVGETVRLVGAPEGFLELLPGVRSAKESDTVLLFVRSAAALSSDLARFAGAKRLWVLWPKKASGVACNVTLPVIHEACGPLGLVAYKTCSVDATWSAAAVARRRG